MADEKPRTNCRVTRVLLDHLSPEKAALLFVELHIALPEKERRPLAEYLSRVHEELKHEQIEHARRRDERWSDD